MKILKLFRAVEDTDFPKQNHFIRRLKGVARDMRASSAWKRTIGDVILDDKPDLGFAHSLTYFIQKYAIIDFLNGLDIELTPCNLGQIKK